MARWRSVSLGVGNCWSSMTSRHCCALAARMRNSFEVTIASDGQEAQSLIEGGFRPDAILCDIEMPRMDGPTFIEWLGEYEPELQGRVWS